MQHPGAGGDNHGQTVNIEYNPKDYPANNYQRSAHYDHPRHQRITEDHCTCYNGSTDHLSATRYQRDTSPDKLFITTITNNTHA